MRRAGTAAAGVVAGALLLSGCGAVDLPLAGVRMGADGVPYALIRPCGDDTYRKPSLDGWAGGDGNGPATTGWDVRKEELSGDAEFPLFSPPGTWRARHRGARRLLPGHHYSLGFGHYVTGDSYNGVVDFSTGDIAALKPGQVWADDRAMSLGEFEKLAEDSC
ncbi:hypothetical protein [Streptomyces rhizosphaerihabitans]|uniref:hypothetical protein n=1 Tax=Streptomyces rhizosphaerihabitans TaxID=1266770 RepID=UPI0021BE8313|nr:hypothetical protein [Streptomyces rhizosphaerihabitans]MCT9007182.1 hypothetical protein [Streptomyces rhizosphaerihabitans]